VKKNNQTQVKSSRLFDWISKAIMRLNSLHLYSALAILKQDFNSLRIQEGP
jgi:hypothetical protein